MKQNNSKSHFRSRNAGRKQNGGHTIGVNTLIDSNGPCGKIKGTALQIMEKYLAAAKDASGADRVLYENCMQHAEYFFRTHMEALAAESERRENMNVVACEPVTEDVDMKNEMPTEDDSDGDVSSDIIALDLSFPDVSKLGQPVDAVEPQVKNTRGRKRKVVKQDLSCETEGENVPDCVSEEDVPAKPKLRCRKVQGL